jgi:nucleoside 2-deoxyribosyltransferase
MQAYIAISYSKRKFLQKELDAILVALKTFSIQPFVFVDNFSFLPGMENEMMQQAFAAIDTCDLLIAETSDKAIGIGIEVGYAKAKNKPILYLRNEKAEHSTTVSGTSDFKIIYSDADDLKKQLAGILTTLVTDINT